jgi:hypothetical protein
MALRELNRAHFFARRTKLNTTPLRSGIFLIPQRQPRVWLAALDTDDRGVGTLPVTFFIQAQASA